MVQQIKTFPWQFRFKRYIKKKKPEDTEQTGTSNIFAISPHPKKMPTRIHGMNCPGLKKG